MLLEQRRLFAHREKESERERAAHTATAHETAHACARCENRRSSAAPSCSSPPLPWSLSVSFSSLSSFLLSPLSPFLLIRPTPLAASPVGLPHGQRIRKRGYTRWINFIVVLSLVRLSRPADDYIDRKHVDQPRRGSVGKSKGRTAR